MTTAMKIRSKNVCVFVNGAVLNNGLFTFPDLSDLIEPAVQKIDLKMEGPSRHVRVKIA